MRFQDRLEAGGQLARLLTRYREENPLVLAIPRGGVVVGYAVARALHAPLDVLVVRKLGAPGYPEFAIGAIAPGGVRVLDHLALEYLELFDKELEQVIAAEEKEMQRRIDCYRGGEPLPDVNERTVLLVDDGLATGATAHAAVQALRKQHPRQLILALPVADPNIAASLRAQVDDLVCVMMPDTLRAISLWYDLFDPVSDDEVIALLERARKERAGSTRAAKEAVRRA